MTFDEIDAELLAYKKRAARQIAPQTIRTYTHAVRQFSTYLEEQQKEASNEALQMYIHSLTDQGLAASTVNKIYSGLCHFFMNCQRSELTNQIRVVKMPSLRNQAPKSLRRLERIQLVEAFEKESKRNRAIFYTLLHTGLRVQELVATNRSDVILTRDEGELRVRQGKGNKERTVPLNKEARTVLKEYLETREDTNSALFLGRKGRLGVRGVQYILKKYAIHPHRLRHTFITDLVRTNDLVLVQSLSGHASTDILSRYSQPSREDLQEAVENIYKER